MLPNGLASARNRTAQAESSRANLLENAAQFPLSLAQESLWVDARITPCPAVYNIPEAWRLKGLLDLQAMQCAVEKIMQRHEALRTVFAAPDAKPVQLVLPPEPFSVPVTDLSGSADPESQLLHSLHTGASRPFDLAQGPLAQFHLFHLAPDHHVLMLNVHHLISDEWSSNVLIRDLAAFYRGYLTGQHPNLPELPIQYADFAVWQREQLAGTPFIKQLEYWRNQMHKPLPVLDLPTDHARPSRLSCRGETQFAELPQALLTELKNLARSQGVTLFMVLLAAFKVLLWRYTRETDIIVGSPMAGRERPETEGLIGFFINLVGLRTKLEGNLSFTQLLRRVRETVLGAEAHQNVPLNKVTEAVQPERDPSRHPLFQVVFGLQPSLLQSPVLPGLEVSRIELDNGGSKFDWSMLVTETPRGPRIRCEYSTDLFERPTMANRLEHFTTLLQAIVAQPAQALSRLPLLTEPERCRLLARGNSLTTGRSGETCVHDWFTRQADSAPEAAALICGASTFNYRDLNSRANRLAHFLKSLGVGPEVPVALYLERSPEMIMAILGVLKAGGAYVPVDPSCPRERLEFILTDSGARLLLTQESLRGTILAPASVRTICLDWGDLNLASQPVTNPTSEVGPANAAYIIYTSGSTGRPKGVVVTHQNVVRLFTQTERWFGFGAADVWTLFHSCAFDFSVWEIWGALLYGGRLVIVPYLVSRSPSEFYHLIAREGVTVLNQTPSAFRQLISVEQTIQANPPLRLRYVICGGEALELQSLKPWFERHPAGHPQVVNMYGITETTVHVTFREIREADLRSGLGSVLGNPIPDLRLYLLDEHLQPVPTGVPGEICVGGAGVARGYLNRPELTGQRFVPDPFQAGERLYRSGDLARYTARGELEYLGRMDEQVKIRGFRIELGEIESALNRHPQVREATVITQAGPGGIPRLIAYYVPVPSNPSEQELRSFLQAILPDYMIPAAFVPLTAMPLTVNGKVDRRALPAPARVQNKPRSGHARKPVEKQIADVWCQVLGLSSLDIEENFFELGGHSLLATQVMSRLAGALQMELSVSLLFEAPTVAQLATAIAQIQRERPVAMSAIERRTPSGQAQELLARLDQLTAAQLDELLRQSEDPKLAI